MLFCGCPPTNLRLPKEYTRPINVSIQLCVSQEPQPPQTQFFLITLCYVAAILAHHHLSLLEVRWVSYLIFIPGFMYCSALCA